MSETQAPIAAPHSSSPDGPAPPVEEAPKAPSSVFRILRKQFTKRGYEYRQVKRSDRVAMYEQRKDGRLHAYEVFRIQVHDARMMGDKLLQAGEAPPPDEQWGKKGWTCVTLEGAEQRYEALHVLPDEPADEAPEETDEPDVPLPEE